VDHPCQQCGVAVEDGRPFCPHCRAPQVRVIVAAPPAPVTLSSESEPAADPLDRVSYHSPAATGLFRIALQAGLLGIIANIIPFGIGNVLTGILAGLLYHRAAGQTLPTSTAARLGAAAGAIASAIYWLLATVTMIFSHSENQIRDMVIAAVSRRADASSPEFQSLVQMLRTPEGFATVLVAGVIFVVILSVFFAVIGCVIGAVLFRERNRPTF
jgi:hypothetical protein